ncbi:hypothetical protein [Desulfosporosinus sp. OT]|uniref:hypothetical protein n=1 Tax=Desulfosporosinus sp. OT TaxID=913865 RepID=UPI000223A9EA|nr:hypothetical protein [Desulfosporosinus sp. OT]EGW41846.1 hypothetical protein DOT_0197 [Desulfosporosinus sp. OT]
METYFHNDPRIEEWIDQITEKVFTVCLLNGVDSEVEFQRGCQIVSKVTSLLQGISTFPSEYLEDGLKQLLEQQLPDARVINNFPSFQDTMNKMLREGMLKAIDSHNSELLDTSISAIEINEEKQIEDQDQTVGGPEESLNEESLTEIALPAFASVITYPDIQKSENEFLSLEVDETIHIDVNSIELIPNVENVNTAESEIELSINPRAYEVLCASQVTEQEGPLQRVLSKLFPNSSISWNVNIMGLTLLAKVDNILIYVLDKETPAIIEDLTKEGWKVLMCSSEDLSFPRRLERGIRQMQRLGKSSKI